jgi:hypothetical protein
MLISANEPSGQERFFPDSGATDILKIYPNSVWLLEIAL